MRLVDYLDHADELGPRFVVDDVAEYHFVTLPRVTYDPRKEFPIVRPPFPKMWMEYRMPKSVNAGGTMLPSDHWRNWSIIGAAITIIPSSTLLDYDRVRMWVYGLEPQNRAVILCGVEYRFGEDGGLAESSFGFSWPDRGDHYTDRFVIRPRKGDPADTPQWGAMWTEPFLMAISFLHCRNVSTVEQAHSPKLQKARTKRGKRPLYTFKRLHIKPTRRYTAETSGAGTGVSPRLHVVRGHFKDYRQHGLGKHHVRGVWWWGPQLRGDASAGLVDKEYVMDTPS